MLRRLVLPLLVLLVLLDLGFTFWQHYQLPLDGDLARIVLPDADNRPVLHDPFGWAALTRHEVYVAPNRFFAHAGMAAYFRAVPLWLQGLLSPIASVYAASALLSTAVQALLLYLLGTYASGTGGLRRRRLWWAIALLVPLFQTLGYQGQMGIIDNAVTYTFFYALPGALLLIFLWPYYRAADRQEAFRLGAGGWAALALLAVVLAFSGPTMPGVVAVLSFGLGLHWLRQTRTSAATGGHWPGVSRAALGLWLVLGALCLYSLYIGQFEAERLTNTLPLLERYRRLPLGLNDLLRRPGFPIFLGATLLNVVLVWRYARGTTEGRRVLTLARWLGLFALLYVLLLPLGGYRNYRPLIIRRDVVQPVLLGLMVLYAMSGLLLARQLPGRGRGWYRGWLVVVAAFFTVSDAIWHQQDNACERQALSILAQSSAPVTELPNDCPVLSWSPISDPAYTETQARMLDYWNVTWGKRLFYQKPKQ